MLLGYPKVMKHPAYTKGIPQEVWARNYKPREGEHEFPGTSDRFPDVTVTNPDQQAWHESRGYSAIDGSTIIGMTGQESYQEYPKWVRSPDGEDILVDSVAHESLVMGHNEPGKLGSPNRSEVPTLDKKIHAEVARRMKEDGLTLEQAVPVKFNKDGSIRKKAGPPKGYKKKPVGDKHAVTD